MTEAATKDPSILVEKRLGHGSIPRVISVMFFDPRGYIRTIREGWQVHVRASNHSIIMPLGRHDLDSIGASASACRHLACYMCVLR